MADTEKTRETEVASDAQQAAAPEDVAGAEAAMADAETAREEATAGTEAAASDEAAAEEPAARADTAHEHTFDELKAKTVAQLREIAAGLGDIEALHGYTTMHKEELVVALCAALDIEAHEHHEVVGIDKAAVKAKIRALKQERDALIEAGDSRQLKIVRRRIRSLKRKIHKATV